MDEVLRPLAVVLPDCTVGSLRWFFAVQNSAVRSAGKTYYVSVEVTTEIRTSLRVTDTT